MNQTLPGPQFVQYFGPVLDALKELGGSARPAEVRDKIVDLCDIPDATQTDLTDSGHLRFDNRVAWARFYLAKAGLLDSSRRGVWALTEAGQTTRLTHDQAVDLFRSIHGDFQQASAGGAQAPDDDTESPDDAPVGTPGYRSVLLDTLRGLSASGFERFCQRLLRESGFQDVTVTGRSGDGGIDGIGLLQVNALVSFKVLFQCKRYVGSVAPSQVRDFRGAMQGRADKGIIITTGTFTSDAKKESVRDGVPPIELVDSDKLLDMLEELELGLTPVRSFQVDESFFEQYQA